ncbi:MAG: hypothetical protein KGJ55_04460 [Gammaproteobacteria bacterium]|nr:hypothetical protein [Gammaproteobacteria bacterium]
MRKPSVKLCLLLSLALAAQSVLAAVAGCGRSAGQQGQGLMSICERPLPAAGHHQTQLCCAAGGVCPLMQAQCPARPVTVARLAPAVAEIPELPTPPLYAGVCTPPLRPPILHAG